MENVSALLLNLSFSLTLALVLGVLAKRLRLSPILGYLLAGIAVGPHTPGFVADIRMAHDFAELGIILLMFGVGLHLNFRDLLAVRKIAIPGSIVQMSVSWVLGMVVAFSFTNDKAAGLVFAFALCIASTVVVVRVLADNDLLQSEPGHIALGWLIFPDIFTVFVLVILPIAAGIWRPAEAGGGNPLAAIGWALMRVAGLVLLFSLVGRKAIPRLLDFVARTRSQELFTLAVLAVALVVATGSAVFFGVSMALGAFLAGLVVGQTEVSHQAAADALPMRDAFAVLFFVSVGMLFHPQPVIQHPFFLLALLGIILVANPLLAFLVIWLLRYPFRTALTVAAVLAQIGEFSFLLAGEGLRLNILTETGQSLLVACALISIAVNPILFRAVEPAERYLRGRERVWRFLSRRFEKRGAEINLEQRALLPRETQNTPAKPRAIIVGYGPVGRTAARILKDFGIPVVIVDLELDRIRGLAESGQPAIFGDAARREILEAAGVMDADYLLVTIPDALTRAAIILSAKELKPDLRVFARARYLQELAWLDEIGATDVSIEEAEAAIGLSIQLLRIMGAESGRIQEEVRKIQTELGLEKSRG